MQFNIIIVGGGAISQQCHLPILLGKSNVNVIGVVDKSPKTRDDLALAYPELAVYADVDDINPNSYDSAVVATPAAFHFQITQSLLNNSKHVLVEKPVAFSATEAEQLTELADKNNCKLSVSLYRRFYPSVTRLKELIESEEWGKALSFDFQWGDSYSWSATSLGNMQKELAGGGVLMDIGPHALDWLCYLFGPEVRLTDYYDDAEQGIETDCGLKLAFDTNNATIEGQLCLSRIRQLGGDLIVECEKATLNLSVGERFQITIEPKGSSNGNVYHYSSPKNNSEDWFATFAKEHDDFFNAIENNCEPFLSSKSVLPAARIIDQCYATKNTVKYDWQNTSKFAEFNNLGIKKVLITGASGFLGGRIVEVLSEQTSVEIIAAVNNPNNATRISRYNNKLMLCDINSPESVGNAIDSCDAVIHCAVGTAYGDDKLIYDTTVEGTQNLLTAAKRNNAKIFVHISSLASVDMNTSASVIDEDSFTPSQSDDIYARSKLAAEQKVQEAANEGLNAVILRPTNIYGPYAPFFKVGAGKQAVTNGVALPASSANSPSNSVYVDNVVVAILTCLSKPADVTGKAYFVNDDDGFTYTDFFTAFTSAFDKPIELNAPQPIHSGEEQKLIGALVKETKNLATSKEMRKLALKLFNSPKLGFPFRWTVEKLPGVENKLRNNDGPVYKDSKAKKTSLPVIEASTKARVSNAVLETLTGTQAITSRDEAIANTVAWIKFQSNSN
ncbi:NAD-dependent epimerase/dehydratase family protein [Alteromonas sp. 5E99-2]|uniref:NAD-dependent epimerase/dehydratase family protein n=1 Tax=Alteromonas sp. 5E99-2 TaxID=2817683 RepID=UPI001A97E228|nr:NAD-dependent epimerase/dehydratase family protein [Alteromonas sp. 5E99-2]MBO1255745.1 NAD-dependent epimerase/dehydratase family protein [Alteromonas sp. 5E99-2]